MIAFLVTVVAAAAFGALYGGYAAGVAPAAVTFIWDGMRDRLVAVARRVRRTR